MKRPDIIYNKVSDFMYNHSVADAERSAFSICNINDETNKLELSIVFARDWNGDLVDDQYLVVKNSAGETTGGVFILPSYWLGIPERLAINHIINDLIDEFYNETE